MMNKLHNKAFGPEIHSIAAYLGHRVCVCVLNLPLIDQTPLTPLIEHPIKFIMRFNLDLNIQY